MSTGSGREHPWRPVPFVCWGNVTGWNGRATECRRAGRRSVIVGRGRRARTSGIARRRLRARRVRLRWRERTFGLRPLPGVVAGCCRAVSDARGGRLLRPRSGLGRVENRRAVDDGRCPVDGPLCLRQSRARSAALRHGHDGAPSERGRNPAARRADAENQARWRVDDRLSPGASELGGHPPGRCRRHRHLGGAVFRARGVRRGGAVENPSSGSGMNFGPVRRGVAKVESAPSAGFEPTRPAPEAGALSPELRGHGPYRPHSGVDRPSAPFHLHGSRGPAGGGLL